VRHQAGRCVRASAESDRLAHAEYREDDRGTTEDDDRRRTPRTNDSWRRAGRGDPDV